MSLSILCPKARKADMEAAVEAVIGSPCRMIATASPSGNPHAAHTFVGMHFGGLSGSVATAALNAALAVPGARAAKDTAFGALASANNLASTRYDTPAEALADLP